MRSKAARLFIVLGAVATSAIAQDAPHPEVIHPDSEEYPLLPEDRMITRQFARDPADAPRTSPDSNPVNLPRDVPAKLTACWSPPTVAENETMQVTVRLSFTRDGNVIGQPATPYLAAKTDDDRRALRSSILQAIKTCTPVRFTPSLGRAIAGRIFAIRFVVHHVTSDQRT